LDVSFCSPAVLDTPTPPTPPRLGDDDFATLTAAVSLPFSIPPSPPLPNLALPKPFVLVTVALVVFPFIIPPPPIEKAASELSEDEPVEPGAVDAFIILTMLMDFCPSGFFCSFFSMVDSVVGELPPPVALLFPFERSSLNRVFPNELFGNPAAAAVLGGDADVSPERKPDPAPSSTLGRLSVSLDDSIAGGPPPSPPVVELPLSED